MSTQRTNTKWALALVAVIAAMGMLAEGEAEDQRRDVLAYCEGVAVFEAEKARGVPLDRRVGHYDWDDNINVAEQCPTAPAAISREHIVYTYPAFSQPLLQIVQF